MNSELLHIILLCMELVAALYILVIGIYTYGLYKFKEGRRNVSRHETKISIIVAARNEAENIGRLLEILCCQSYPKSNYDITIVDDHSEDETLVEIEKTKLSFPDCDIKVIKAIETGKKAALELALHQVRGKLVLLTDADCRPSLDWVSAVETFYCEKQSKMILGPVLLSPSQTFFQKLQVVEHLSLIGSTAGAALMRIPVMCNGANLAYEREAALAVEKSRNDRSYSSGDDMFLMEAFIKKFGRDAVDFLFDRKALVETTPIRSLKGFFRQRTRWVSKSKGYTNPYILTVAGIVGLFNLGIVACFVAAFFKPWFWAFFLLYVLLKFLIDFPLLRKMLGFMQLKRLQIWTLPLEFVYPFYVVLTAFIGLFGKTSWKGRKVKR
jgi:Glycosyltransferases, probably involved in cell wall biogenesis